MDSELSDRELSLLRRLYFDVAQDEPPHNVILQNLWNVYGVIFTDKTLLSATLLFACRRFAVGSVEFLTHVSRFHRNLASALQQNNITDCHFFALALAFMSLSSGELRNIYGPVYLRGCIEVLRSFRQKSISFQSAGSVPRSLYHYFYWIVILEQVWGPRTRSLDFEMLELGEALPSGNDFSVQDFSDPRAYVRISLRNYPQTFQSDDFLLRLPMSSNEIFYSVYACFQLFYASSRSSFDEPKVRQIYRFIRQARRNLETTLALPSVIAIFQRVYIEFIALLIHQIWEIRPAYRAPDLRLKSRYMAFIQLLRSQCLLSLLETVKFGRVDHDSTVQLVQQVMQLGDALADFGSSDCHWYFSDLMPVTAMCLAPWSFQNDTG